ncbi:MAG: hypothetical protein ABI599_09555 [Flavobacteriales bacterium]
MKTLRTPLLTLALLLGCAACTKEAPMAPSVKQEPDCTFPLLNDGGGTVDAGRVGWEPTEPHLED